MSNKYINIGLDLLYNPYKVKQENTISESSLTYEEEIHYFVENMIKKYPEKKNELHEIFNKKVEKKHIFTQTD